MEISSGLKVVKYLYKYLTKGDPKVNLKLGKEENQADQFLNGRYLCAGEAVWRLLSYHMHGNSPAVV